MPQTLPRCLQILKKHSLEPNQVYFLNVIVTNAFNQVLISTCIKTTLSWKTLTKKYI
ncbi:hypothetical protein HanRHA438_Chr17g0834851 [Helianthus annuus]|nr:hypothetical protein HanRHA438_Chr17g0834851 [Helianthus annuus]